MKEITKHLTNSLKGQGAHISFKDALEDFPFELAGKKIPQLEHTMWMLVYHIWICANDIIEFSLSPKHKSPHYPTGYWPKKGSPESREEWNHTIDKTISEMNRMADILEQKDIDLLTPFPWGTGQNLFKEALVLIDHNSYHIAQMVDLRFLLDAAIKDW
ncbi:MAG: DinB family protein [Spirochaetaceae bacterium]|jgi:hypothetical protein|nr:DinB family protein [Spirochaetaceae bacterium]